MRRNALNLAFHFEQLMLQCIIIIFFYCYQLNAKKNDCSMGMSISVHCDCSVSSNLLQSIVALTT